MDQQNDIVAQILAMIGQQGQQGRSPMIANKQFPAIPPPPGNMPQPIGMPPGAQDIALQAALGDVPTGEGAVDPGMLEQLPPELLEMVLQGRIPQPPGQIPAQPEWLKRLGPSGTMSSSPLRMPFNRKQ